MSSLLDMWQYSVLLKSIVSLVLMLYERTVLIKFVQSLVQYKISSNLQRNFKQLLLTLDTFMTNAESYCALTI